jgi:ADP-ribose pyrophosphatase YjhB (NUDIX family)
MKGDMSAEPVRGAGAVIRDFAGRLLLIQRGHEPALGRWSLPGGRLEPGETSAQAVVREVREETGLDVEVSELLASVDLGPYLVDDFSVTVIGGQLQAGDDAADVRWCTPDEMATLPLTDGLIEWLRQMKVL